MSNLALRPQPLGVFPLPASYLVLPDADGAAALRDELIQGRAPESAPEPLRFYLLALAGDTDGALAALAGNDTPEARYNRFVLQSDEQTFAELRADLSGDLGLLLGLVGYTLGWTDAPPRPDAADGELAAVLRSAWAAHALELDRERDAAKALSDAAADARAVSPLLAAQLLGDLGDLQGRLGDGPAATMTLREAVELADGRGLPDLHAQLSLRLGMLYQELSGGSRGALLEAARRYQEALRHYTRETAPEMYALAQNNLALAYLAMPLVEASDKLRMAIAVQGLREALTVYTREAHPERWASAQLNLANALQYLPSAHPEDHLAEAVELYEELLAARDERSDPLGYARLLANQGNALAHLGIFGHARYKLSSAAALFARAGDMSSAQAVEEVLATVAQHEQDREVRGGAIPASAV